MGVVGYRCPTSGEEVTTAIETSKVHIVPDMSQPLEGCRFAARCPFVSEPSRAAPPPLIEVSPGHLSRCIKAPLERLVS